MVKVCLLAQMLAIGALGARCPPPGPVLPPPAIPAQFDPNGLQSTINRLMSSERKSWNTSTNSFSFALTSINNKFFEYHHAAKVRDPTGTKKITGDSVYRIMSITKLIHTFTFLLAKPYAMDMEIANYLPELQGVREYNGVTFRMLVTHSAGVPRDANANDRYLLDGENLQQVGFPKPDLKYVPKCDNVGLGPCSRKVFFDHLHRDGMTLLPGQSTGYSNQAFILLGMALQNMTGKSFGELLHDKITQPLGLSVTGFNAPERSRGVIPTAPGDVFWGYDIGNFNLTAGLYSSPNELLTLARGIMNHKLLPPAATRQWMRPAGFAGSYTTAVGAAWEIFRVSYNSRPVDIYTKAGGMPGWSSYIVFVPDYNVAGVINACGNQPDGPANDMLDIFTTSVIPAMDSLARKQAYIYVGRYSGPCSGLQCDPDAKSTLELAIDSGPGLRIKGWTNNGKSILDVLAADNGMKVKDLEVRLYPVGEGNKWRMAVEKASHRVDTARVPSEACFAWLWVDTMRYASYPVDEFTFDVKDGRVISVKNSGLRASLNKE